MRQVTGADFDSFVAAKPAAVILFDADWDVGYRPIAREKMLQAEEVLEQSANFGEVDVDRSIELAKSLRLLGVPCVAYFRAGKLIAALTGARQNVRARLERVLRGEAIGRKDGNDGSF